jgi:hypothetical protein
LYFIITADVVSCLLLPNIHLAAQHPRGVSIIAKVKSSDGSSSQQRQVGQVKCRFELCAHEVCAEIIRNDV